MQFFETAGLPVWDESAIEKRQSLIKELSLAVQYALKSVNPAWQFYRYEAPEIMAVDRLSGEYDDSQVFYIGNKIAGKDFCLRPETTPTSYAIAKKLMGSGKIYNPPVCFWQAGPSYRVERNDGASASKMRFNRFWQCEFQCIYSRDTKADYRTGVELAVRRQIQLNVKGEAFLEASDRLPAYSLQTTDINVRHGERVIEACSISTRNDFDEKYLVLEVAVGLDRLILLNREGE